MINLPPLTKRQCIQYLPQETLEAHQQREELAKEMGVSAVGRGSPCERYADFVRATGHKTLGESSVILQIVVIV